jgi:glycosyltransferase involved in cell wall biosynthesis
MPHVLVISEKYWPEGGGAELATHRIIKYLSSRGFEITVLTGTPNPSPLKNVKYVYEPLLRVPKKIQLWINCLVFQTTRKFKKIVESADIVYIPGIAYPLIIGISNKKIVAHLHNYQPIQYTQFISAPYEKISDIIGTPILDYYLGKLEYSHISYGLGAAYTNLFNRLNKVAIKRVNIMLCPSKRQKEIIMSKFPELSGRLHAVPNPPPIMPNIKNLSKSEIPTIIYAGGKSKVKGLHIALNVILQLATKKHKFKAYMLGMSARPKVVKKYSSEILLYPMLLHHEVLNLLSRSWALLFTSIIEEPFPYIVYEAAFLGALPISTNVGGVFEMLEETIGQRYVVDLYDYQNMIGKTSHILSMSLDDFIGFSKILARQMKEKYNENNILNTYLKIFEDV